jgi:hypothetical protein
MLPPVHDHRLLDRPSPCCLTTTRHYLSSSAARLIRSHPGITACSRARADHPFWNG